MRFCPICGKKDIEGEMCSSCAAREISSAMKISDITVTVCVGCKSAFIQNKWVKFSSLGDILLKLGRKAIGNKLDAKIIPLIPEKAEMKPGLNVDAEIEVALSEKEKYYIPAKFIMTTCPKCGKEGGQYFESMLQLRDCPREIIDFVKADVFENRKRGAFIVKEDKVGSGIDMQLTSNNYAKSLGKRLVKRFGGILKVNARLYSTDRQTSKQVHRVTVFYQAMPFKIGEVMLIDGRVLKVTEIGKQLYGYDLRLGKKVSFGYKKKPFTILQQKKTTVVKVYPKIEVLHPDNYENVVVKNSAEVKNGEEVSVVVLEDSGEIFLV